MFKNSLAIFSLITTLLVSSTVVGQVDKPGPRFRPDGVETVDHTRPFAEPGVFNYDVQAFAPMEFSGGEDADPQVGFFFTYDRMYTSLSRPGGNADILFNSVPEGSDYIWGNRYEFGYMTDNDEGWGLVFKDSEGSFYAAGQDALVGNPMWVTTKVGDFALNRMFRQPLSRGGYMEPFIGLRYISLSDNTIEDTTQATGNNRFRQNVTNSAFGVHAGARYIQRAGRFRWSCNSSIATLYNQQQFFGTDIFLVTTPPATLVSESYDTDQSFVPVLDLGLEVAYNLSRDIALRGGLQMSYLWDGVARVNTLTTGLNPNSNFGAGGAAAGPAGLFDKSVMQAGFTFGVEWKR